MFPIGISDEEILSEYNFTEELSIYSNLTLDNFTEKYRLVISNTLIPVFSIVSVLSNLAIFGLLISLRLNNRVYNYLIFKSFLLVLISASYIPMGNGACLHCKSHYYNTQLRLLQIYVTRVSSDSVALMVGLTETLIAFDRLCLLKNTKNWLTKLKQKYATLWIILFSLALN